MTLSLMALSLILDQIDFSRWIKMRSSEMDQNFEIEPFSVARILSLLVVVSSRISFFGGVESKVDGPKVRKWTSTLDLTPLEDQLTMK